ncbi:hypothetical protein [Rubellicoccus peritrichatus]|uniref:6-bladed beta-propeller n=1 Tax=Rubellicoccus peritrichatus TaxID=3080537 RepID=A0AAQ3L5R4_9BACT|nr:hypothetical protein [Puniceicoccus sp. CR14]WOO39381.1 hypothetical protein RZN69_12220 [Puniceicoccus sp. CR14]
MAFYLRLFIYLLPVSLLGHNYHAEEAWLESPASLDQIGNTHGEVAVAANGEIYLSVQGGELKGIQVYSPDGQYLRNVPGAPNDIHGFVIRQEDDDEFIYYVQLQKGTLVKMNLSGEQVWETPHTQIPEKYLLKHKETGQPRPRFTMVDVAPDGRIFVVDGYGTDNIHVFDAKGEYLDTYVMKAAPFSCNNLHKIHIDTRYADPRILGCDRRNDRLIHLTLDGEWIGEYATGLRRPSAAAFRGDVVVIAEINGRISILDKAGKITQKLGTNDNPKTYGHNKTRPAEWKTDVVHSPHGIAFDQDGDIIVSEYNQFGRVLCFKALN